MNISKKLFIVLAITVVSAIAVFADDLNPPDYRGAPLSVYAHWLLVPGTPSLGLVEFTWQDDLDPTTTLYPTSPPDIIVPEDKTYEFYLPNFIDNLPVKLMRLQLTWINSDLPPTVYNLAATEGFDPVFGNIVNTSPVMSVGPTGGVFYQYYDIEFKPNPDQERWLVSVQDNAYLIQAVVDTISTVPEPATLMLLGIGGIALRFRRK